jgi:hypothetical protein
VKDDKRIANSLASQADYYLEAMGLPPVTLQFSSMSYVFLYDLCLVILLDASACLGHCAYVIFCIIMYSWGQSQYNTSGVVLCLPYSGKFSVIKIRVTANTLLAVTWSYIQPRLFSS